MEGLRLSCEVEHSSLLAGSHAMFVIRLSTPADQCTQNLIRRRRTGLRSTANIAAAVGQEERLVAAACDRLRTYATVEVLSFDQAYARTLELLAICSPASASHQGKGPGIFRLSTF
jgi:hypothetical protein